jgi:hypothetical protein
MAGPRVDMAEPKAHMFDLILGSGWAVIAGPKVYMSDPKVRVFDFRVHLI